MEDVEKARRVLRQSQGDPLGLVANPELSFAVAHAAARRFMAGDHSDAALSEWRGVVEEIIAQQVGGDAPDAIAQRLAHRVLVRACEEWMAAGRSGNPTEYLTQVLLGSGKPETPDRNVVARTASILFTMAWRGEPATAG